MRIDAPINRLLAKLFGAEDAQGNRTVWFHSQNLNEDRNGKVKGWPYEGRCWLHSSKRNHRVLGAFSWHLWTHFCGASISTDREDGGTKFHVSFPPVAFWLTLPIPLQKLMQGDFWRNWNQKYGGYRDSHSYTEFELFNITIHDKSLFWSFLKYDWGWSRKMPKWMSGSFNFADFLLGKSEYTKNIVETKDVQIPMPEGLYPAKAEMEECTWKRPRWFALKKTYVTLNIPRGIPHQGKGENSYDCGEDALCGISADGPHYEKAIAKAVESALQSRRKYDGNLDAVYPNPADRKPLPPPPENPEACA